MKKIGFAIVLFASSTLFSFVVAGRLAEDLWKRLGINRQEGAEKVSKSFLQGWLHHEGLSNVKNLALNDRAAVAKDLMTFSKQYLSGAAFKAEYDKQRKDARPMEPEDHTQTKEQIRQVEVDKLKKSVETLEQLAKTLPADQQKTYQESINTLRTSIKDYQDPNNKTIEAMYQNQLREHQHDLDRQKAETKKWETEFPADVRQFIKARMQHYLDVAGTVDFSAELVENGGKKRFVNPAYQAKSNEWKMIYRAGKDVYGQAKVFIEQWMTEL